MLDESNYALAPILPDQSQFLEMDWAPESRFPTSSVRSEAQPHRNAAPPNTLSGAVEPRRNALKIPTLAEDDSELTRDRAIKTSYSLHVPFLPEVAPGVLSDGTFTSRHPEVRQFLDAARANPRMPPPSSAPVFALAALVVLHHPMDPAHWVFWRRERRKRTAQLVQRALNTMPIKSHVSWMGVPENLWMLGACQHAWQPTLLTMPWYAPFAEASSKSQTKTRMSLRKRKPAPPLIDDLPIEALREPEVGTTSAPSRKRARTAKAVAADNDDAPESDMPPPKRPRVDKKAAKATSPPVPPSTSPIEPTSARSTPLSLLTPSTETTSLPEENEEPGKRRISLRQKQQKSASSKETPSSSNRVRPTRERSLSSLSAFGSVSESSTVVNANRPRSASAVSASLSDLSVATVVDENAGNSGKGSAKPAEIEDAGKEDAATDKVAGRTRASARISKKPTDRKGSTRPAKTAALSKATSLETTNDDTPLPAVQHKAKPSRR